MNRRDDTQLARFALKSGAGSDTAVEVKVVRGQAVVRVARRDAQGLTIDDGTLRARIIDGTDTREIGLRPREPGLWDAALATQGGHAYTVEVLGKDGKVVARHSFAPPPSAEQRDRTPDRAWLAEVSARSGGRSEPDAIVPTALASVTAEVQRLRPFFALFAARALAARCVGCFSARPGTTYVHDGGSWPTLSEMIAANTRLVVTAEDGATPPPWYQHVWDLTWDTPYTFMSIDAFNCDPNRGDPTRTRSHARRRSASRACTSSASRRPRRSRARATGRARAGAAFSPRALRTRSAPRRLQSRARPDR